MSLSSVIDTAWSGLDAASRRLQVVSQNVANAGTAGYARETTSTVAVVADGAGAGARVARTGRATDELVQAGAFHANAQQAALSARSTALAAVDAASGTVGSGTDLASRLGALQDGFSALANDPANESAQRAVLRQAADLAGALNTVSAAIGTQRQAAQDSAVAGVAALNTALYAVGTLTDRIKAVRAAGGATPDLENARDAQLGTLSGLVDVTVLRRDDGDLLLASGGTILPQHPADGAFALSAGTLAADTPTAAVPRLTLDGAPAQVTGGALGGALAVRDEVLPAQQASLDELAHTLATRFDAQGLTLFTDSGGTVPPGGTPHVQSGYVGFTTTITVNPAVAATPSRVRDGTHDVAASAFTVGTTAGGTALIRRVLDFALGTQVRDGVAQPGAATSGLGADGTIAHGGTGTGALSSLAGALVAAQAASADAASSQLGTATTLASTLQTKLTAATGVSVDTELSTMVQLQNAYSANARVLSTVKDLWTDLLGMVR